MKRIPVHSAEIRSTKSINMFFKKFFYFTFILACQTLVALGKGCHDYSKTSGEITKSIDSYIYKIDTITECWDIKVPPGTFVRLTLKELIGFKDCTKEVLEVKIEEANKTYTYCSQNVPLSFYHLVALNDVRVIHTIYNGNSYFYYNKFYRSFSLHFETVDILCVQKDAFHCSEVSCIPSSSVCDGVDDCEDGKDEIKCERGVLAIDGIQESREKAIFIMKSRRTSSWGWRENTHRAIVGLYLAENNSSKNTLEDELMRKQLELRTAVALLRNGTNPLSHNDLGMIVNALLMICRNPRHFYGYDMVKLLKEQVGLSRKNAHPMAYLALCNAGESLDEKDLETLIKIFNSSNEYLFFLDVQAVAVMVVSCMQNNGRYQISNNSGIIDSVVIHYNKTISRFKELQNSDGSFGNVYTSALIIQALLSSGDEESRDWNLEAGVKFLMSQLKSSEDFLTIYLTLPILNAKSLTDIAEYDCVKNRNFNVDRSLDYVQDKLGLKMTVQYSLYVGDNMDIIYTIFVRVPEHITAYEVMQVAEVADPKYKFKSKKMSDKTYVYELANIANDPEAGKYWILYLTSGKSNVTIAHYNEGPDELEMRDGEHLVMWYKTAQI